MGDKVNAELGAVTISVGGHSTGGRDCEVFYDSPTVYYEESIIFIKKYTFPYITNFISLLEIPKEDYDSTFDNIFTYFHLHLPNVVTKCHKVVTY